MTAGNCRQQTTTNAIHISPRWGYSLHVGVTFVVTLSRKHQFLSKVLDCVRLLWIADQLNYIPDVLETTCSWGDYLIVCRIVDSKISTRPSYLGYNK